MIFKLRKSFLPRNKLNIDLEISRHKSVHNLLDFFVWLFFYSISFLYAVGIYFAFGVKWWYKVIFEQIILFKTTFFKQHLLNNWLNLHNDLQGHLLLYHIFITHICWEFVYARQYSQYFRYCSGQLCVSA